MLSCQGERNNMKTTLQLCFLVTLQVFAATIPDLLREFRQNTRLEIGVGYGRAPAQVFTEGRGTHLELTMAFKSILEKEGFQCKIVIGKIQLTEEQKNSWHPIGWERLGELLGSDGTGLPFSWLQLDAPALPDMLIRNVIHSPYAMQTIELFPALNGFERFADNAREMLWIVPHFDESGIQAIQWGTSSPTPLTFYPYQEMWNAFHTAFEPLQWLFCDEWTTHHPGIAGNTIHPQFAPVQIVSRDFIGDNLPEEYIATLAITLSNEENEFFSVSLPQHLVSQLDLEWLWEDSKTPPQAGDLVQGRTLQGSLILDGTTLATCSNIPLTDACYLNISRNVPTFGCTDTIKGIIPPVGISRIIFYPSLETGDSSPFELFIRESANARETALLVAKLTDTSLLDASLLTLLPILQTIDDTSQSIHSFVPTLSHLFHEESPLLLPQKTQYNTHQRITAEILSTLLSLATAHRLQWDVNPSSLLSSLWTDDPFRSSHISVHKSYSMPDKLFKTAPQQVIQINEDYPRHIITIHPDGQVHIFSQYSASSLLLPSPIFFPTALPTECALLEDSYTRYLPAFIAQQLFDINSFSLSSETLALADATLIAFSAFWGNKADEQTEQEEHDYPFLSERPALTLESTAFDGNEVTCDIDVIVNVTNLLPSRIELLLNGEHYDEINYPDVPTALFTINVNKLKDGINTISARAWNSVMQPSDDVEGKIIAPIMTSFAVSPRLVQTWNGTDSSILLTATMRHPHPWLVFLSGNGVELQQNGESEYIRVSFDTSELPDGFYTLTLMIPSATSYSVSIEIDNVRGTPTAMLTYPENDSILREGILSVQGSATTTNGDAVGYYITLGDEYGNEVSLETEEHNGTFRLIAMPPKLSLENPAPRQSAPLEQAELAKMDLSSLPNGIYTLTLFVTASGVTAFDSVTFSLESELKAEALTFTEEDFTIQAGSLPVKISRHYSSLEYQDSGYGVGWRCNKDFEKPNIDETRAEIDTQEGDESFSIRTGGTRDVMVTLSTGQRVRFRFDLVQGGGWSFCYYATWKAPEGIHATLVPTCSNKLMTLTELEPYWEAAGPETPWQLFDFPGFTLTESDGTVSALSRDLLAEANLLGDDTLPIAVEDGESIFIQAYGELKLSSKTLPNGRKFLFDDTSISTVLNGNLCKILEMTWDDARRHVITAASYLPNGTQAELDTMMQYEYEGDNLISVKRSKNGGPFKLFRSYAYENPAFPHYITTIKNGYGEPIMTAQFDNSGHMNSATGPNGEPLSAQRDTFSGFESKSDALGRETLIYFDAYGSITEEITPNGAKRTFQYDEQHREIAVTDAYGNTLHKGYDEEGNLTSLTRPDGSQATFLYDEKRCIQSTDFSGNCSYFSYDGKGQLSTFKAPNGNSYNVERDSDGNLNALTLNGKLVSQSTYDSQGRLNTVTDYATGTQYAFTHDFYSNTTETRFTMFDPNSGEEVSQTIQAQYDDENRLVSSSTSDGFWQTFQYDANGKLSHSMENSGQKVSYLYDRSGEIVQIVDENSLVIRYGRDAAGQTIFIAGPEQADSHEGTIVFCKATLYEYDSLGCITKTTEVNNAKVSLQSTGIDTYRADLLIWENPVSAQASYDLKGRMTSTTSREGFSTSFDYNSTDRLSSTTDHFGNKTSFEYNAAGKSSKLLLPDNSAISFSYDNCGRPLEITDPLGHKQRFSFSNDGKLLSLTAPDSSLTTYEYDENGLLQSAAISSDIQGNTYLYDYDSGLSLSSIEMPSGRKLSFVNDYLGRRISTKLPLGQHSSTSYETSGLLPIQHTDFAGNRTEYAYDCHANPISKAIIPQGETSPKKRYSYTYLPSGKPASVELESGNHKSSILCTYDDHNRLTSFQNEYFSCTTEYDLDGNLSAFSTENTSFHIARDKNSPQIVTTYTKASGHPCSADNGFVTEFDSCGRIHSITCPDTSRRQFNYDTASNLESVTFSGKDTAEIYSFSCTRDSCNRIVATTESLLNQPILKEYTYDAHGRLASETRKSNGNKETDRFFYDIDGNLCKNTTSNNPEETVSRFFDDNGRLVRLAGNNSTTILSWNDNGSLLSICEYDTENHLTFSQSFTWDCEGLLQETLTFSQGKTYTTTYEYDAKSMLCASSCIEGNTSSGKLLFNQQYFYHSPGDKGIPMLMEIVSIDRKGQVLHQQSNVWMNGLVGFYLDGIFRSCICDYGGTVIAVQSQDGNMESRQYTVWGLPLDSTELLEPNLGYRGELYVPVNGLLYLRSRFFMPKLGIFISADRHEPNLMIPQELNGYAYCRNDPVNRVDPMGSFSIGCISMTSMLSTMVNSLVLGIKLDLIFQTIYSCYLSHEMALEFASASKSNTNATAIVHGVWKHEPNYAAEFVNRLERYAPYQDYYQFRWSGFGGFLLPTFIPNVIQHNIAKRSLEFCLGCLRSQGYANINVIGHSWGTVLSKDALNTGVIDVALWTTMGSPLATEELSTKNGFLLLPSYPLFNYEKWMNFYNLCDPIVYLCMNNPLRTAPGPNINESLCSPLFESSLPEQYNLGFITPDPHGCYWYNPTTILAITLFTRLQ